MQHIPFDYNKKGIFGAKVAAYLVTGFALPFVAAYYQLYVSLSLCTDVPSPLRSIPSASGGRSLTDVWFYSSKR